MRLLVLSPPPPGLAAALRRLADDGQATVLVEGTGESGDGGSWDATLAAADRAVAAPLPANSRAAAHPLVIWGDEGAALAALEAGADLWVDADETPARLAGRIRAAIRASQRDVLSAADGLTGLPGPLAFDELLEHEFDRATRYKRRLAVLALEPDRLREIRDTAGAAAADLALRETAALLRPLVREVDAVARLPRDRFGLLFPETDAGGAVVAAGRLRSALAAAKLSVPRPSGRGATQLRLSASVGLAAFPQRGVERPKDLHGRALESLIQAQRDGGDRVVAFGAPDIIWSRNAPDPSSL